MEEARFPLVTLHYGMVLGCVLCLCPYTGTSLVPYRKLPSTVTMNTESSSVSIYSNYLVSCNSTGLPEPKAYTFKYKNKLLFLALALSSRRILAGEDTPVRQRMTTNAFPGSFVP